MSNTLEKRLNYCNMQLDVFFHELPVNEVLKNELQAIKRYYHCTLINAGSNGGRVVEFYEFFIGTLSQVKSNAIAIDDAIRAIEQKTTSREHEIFWTNLLNGLSLTFLSLLATAAYLSLYALVASSFAVHPILGLAVLVLASELFVQGMVRILNGFIDFESPTPIKEECKREADVISFFKSRPPSTVLELSAPLLETENMLPDTYLL